MHTNRIRLAAGTLLLCLPSVAVAAGLQIGDTVAGIGTSVTVTGLPAGERSVIRIGSPVGPDTEVPVEAGTDGGVVTVIPGSMLELAGTYRATLPAADPVEFRVEADVFDPDASGIQAESSAAAPGEDVTVTVTLRDRFGNPLAGRPVEVLSSVSADRIGARTRETDAQGRQEFIVTPATAGSRTLRAVDLLSGTAVTEGVELGYGSRTAMGGTVSPYPAYQTAPSPYGYPPQYPYAQPPAPYPPYPAYPQYNPYAASLMGPWLYGQASSFDIIAAFEIRAPQQLNTNEYATITLRAVDALGRTVEDYTGRALLSSTDAKAFLPLSGEIDFRPQDLGEKTLTLGLLFRTPGTQTLVVRDSTNQDVQGTLNVEVTGETGVAGGLLTVTSPADGSMVSEASVTVEGTGPPFINLLVTGGSTDVMGETDQNGAFSIVVPLSATQRDHTLRVRDESGQLDSGNLHLILDNTPPVISSLTYNPVSPEEGTQVIIVAQSDPGVVLTLAIGSQTFPMEESSSSSGTYQLLLTAPPAGTYQPLLVASDSSGNKTEIRSNFVVAPKGLGTVKNVKAEPGVKAVSLRWDELKDEDIESYRIYVGDAADNLTETIDTEEPVTAATVTGLQPGRTYFFSVTGLRENLESIERSKPVKATVLGLALEAAPGDGSLTLRWNLSDGVPLSSFIVEYGVEPERLTEKRTLDGEQRTFVLRDLLNEVTYHVKLTPVTTTGEALRDLAATVQGMPGGNAGFRPTSGEPAPFMPALVGGALHGGAPQSPIDKSPVVSATGLPARAWGMIGLAALMLFAFHWQRRRLRAMEDTVAFLRSMDRRYRVDA